MPAVQPDRMLDVLKRAAAVLRDAGVPFALCGGIAAWARGGPASDHDIDLLVPPDDASRALDALAAAGFRTEVPPEGWLYKAWDGDVLVDLIFQPTGISVDAALDMAEVRNVYAVPMAVMSVDDMIVTKLLALTEHHLDYGPVLEWARSLREQVDWTSVRRRTDGSPFARAFFSLIEELDIVELPVAAPTKRSSA
jgi:putative nucleotidyltransferase-like protein